MIMSNGTRACNKSVVRPRVNIRTFLFSTFINLINPQDRTFVIHNL